MPFIQTKTNIEVSKEQELKLKSRFGEAISLLGKSEGWLMLNFDYNQNMYFKGQDKPMAFVDISVFGKSTDAQCADMTVEVCKILGDILGIPADSVYVKYSGTNQWGWNNMNF